jgi:AcrR family transcriptional regulator
LVATAERLFAEQGVGAVSVRHVNKEAGLGAAAVHYHFGSKEALLEAVVRRLSDPIAVRFIEGSERLLSQRRRPTTRDLVNVWALPIIGVLDDDQVRGSRWLRVTTHLSRTKTLALLGPDVGRIWTQVLERAFPAVPPAESSTGWMMATVVLPRLLARATEAASPAAANERSRYIEGCLEFAAHGLQGFIALAERSGANGG